MVQMRGNDSHFESRAKLDQAHASAQPNQPRRESATRTVAPGPNRSAIKAQPRSHRATLFGDSRRITMRLFRVEERNQRILILRLSQDFALPS